MRLTSISLYLAALGLPLLLGPSRPASACDPAPDHSVTITADDSPECARVEDGFSYAEATLRVDNQCEQAFVLEADDCEDCGPTLTVEPGEDGEFIIETRNQGSTATLRWSTGEMSGQVATRVEWRDNSDACDGPGCHVGDPGRRSPWLLGTGLLLLGLAARRRRPR